MTDFVNELVLNNLLIVFAIIAVLEALKKIGLPVKYIELVSIVIGAVFTMLLNGIAFEAVLNGFVIGLASCKLYDKVLDIAFNKFEPLE